MRLPVRTGGVMGDAYDRVSTLKAIASTDGMAADPTPMPREFFGCVSI